MTMSEGRDFHPNKRSVRLIAYPPLLASSSHYWIRCNQALISEEILSALSTGFASLLASQAKALASTGPTGTGGGSGPPLALNRPGFSRHFQAVHYGNHGGVYERQAVFG